MVEELTSLTNLLIMASLLLNVITLFTVVRLVRKNKAGSSKSIGGAATETAATTTNVFSSEAGAVFCRNCGDQYDSTSAVCPSCHTRR
ncbi:hypothetical protein LCM10_09330 [Rossellomorea aquimaris]|uniref:hypothetical protein n=1 Tax=Rossellomorea aquimaris TaxID=189382 RepID=UPI001CD622E8|nr:hypothetical protein [Rossellomorea aquimaris]MCA1055189.1 hypothetical protein [Rossellomorea aquimaris]